MTRIAALRMTRIAALRMTREDAQDQEMQLMVGMLSPTLQIRTMSVLHSYCDEEYGAFMRRSVGTIQLGELEGSLVVAEIKR
jgi:hypothetical protein